MRFLHTAQRLLVAILVVAACSSGAGVSAMPSARDAASPSVMATRIEVTLTDDLRIQPASMTVPVGEPITFIVTNAGANDHEFFLGDKAAQAAHEKDMAEMGGMPHDEPAGIAVAPSQTRELTYTFADHGETIAGCHVPGHYAGGMRAIIAVV